MLDVKLTGGKNVPIYRRIAAAVTDAVAAGRIQAGDRLPPEAALAKDLGVNVLTVSRGYELLENDGLVRQRRGSGTFVEPGAVQLVRRRSQRQIGTLTVVIGENSLARCRRETLFIVVDEIEGMRDALGEKNTRLVFAETLTRPMVEAMREDDAVVLASAKPIDPDAVAELMRRGLPTVGMWWNSEWANVPRVRYDRQQSVRLACRHLVECGYQRIGYIGMTPRFDAPVGSKFHTFASVVHEAGLDIHARYIREANVIPGKAYAAAWAMVQTGDLPQAFFVDTDYKAMEVIGALKDGGVRVPEDVGIVGYDDAPEATTFTPPLTTVRTPRREIGRHTAQLLLDWPTDGAVPGNVLLSSELIVRASTSAGSLQPAT